MDRISALRNVEDALAEFERGERDLAGMERRVLGVLRTYATEFDAAGEARAAYRVEADREEAVVVVAAGPGEARERAAELADVEADRATVERLGNRG
jgi:hypothetical protein